MSSSIKPTIGRKIYYWSDSNYGCKDPLQAFDATIIYVVSETVVDIVYTNHFGSTRSQEGVNLHDPVGGECHGAGPFATWMPYQVGQAVAAASRKL